MVKNHKRVGVDIDGCLADFNSAYKVLLEKHTGYMKFPEISDSFPNTWAWERAAGVPEQIISQVWSTIKEDPNFWLKLEPYGNTIHILHDLYDLALEGHDIYFITHRMGVKVKEQTEKWLTQYGGPRFPTVLVTGDKGIAASSLDLTHFIDDRPENCYNVWDEHYIEPHNYLLHRPWNVILSQHVNPSSMKRLQSMEEFIKILKEGA